MHPSQIENEFTFLTESSLHLRQALIPECNKKDIKLPFYYYSFLNLVTEFKSYNSCLKDIKNLIDIANCKFLQR